MITLDPGPMDDFDWSEPRDFGYYEGPEAGNGGITFDELKAECAEDAAERRYR